MSISVNLNILNNLQIILILSFFIYINIFNINQKMKLLSKNYLKNEKKYNILLICNTFLLKINTKKKEKKLGSCKLYYIYNLLNEILKIKLRKNKFYNFLEQNLLFYNMIYQIYKEYNI